MERKMMAKNVLLNDDGVHLISLENDDVSIPSLQVLNAIQVCGTESPAGGNVVPDQASAPLSDMDVLTAFANAGLLLRDIGVTILQHEHMKMKQRIDVAQQRHQALCGIRKRYDHDHSTQIDPRQKKRSRRTKKALAVAMNAPILHESAALREHAVRTRHMAQLLLQLEQTQNMLMKEAEKCVKQRSLIEMI